MMMWDILTGELVLSGKFVPWTFSQDGGTFAGSTIGSVAFCRLNTPQIVKRFAGHRSRLAKVAWLKEFFRACDRREGEGKESDGEEHTRLLTGAGGERWN